MDTIIYIIAFVILVVAAVLSLMLISAYTKIKKIQKSLDEESNEELQYHLDSIGLLLAERETKFKSIIENNNSK